MTVLERFGAVDFATTIAPGLRDVLLIGKVYEAAGRRTRAGTRPGGPAYDAVVLDAPPDRAGSCGSSTSTPRSPTSPRWGPIRTQADSITRMLRSHTTAVHVVTLLEEMPVQETVDALADLRRGRAPAGRHRRQPAARRRCCRQGQLASVRRRPRPTLATGVVTADLKSVSVRDQRAMVAGLLDDAAEHADRVALEQRAGRDPARAGPAQVCRLPLLPEGTDAGGHHGAGRRRSPSRG